MMENKKMIIIGVVAVIVVAVVAFFAYRANHSTVSSEVGVSETAADSANETSTEEEEDTYIPNEQAIQDRETVKLALREYYETNYKDIVEDVKTLNVKVYTQEEIDAEPLLADYHLNDQDIVFEVEYNLKIVEGYEDMMQFTAGTGVIDGQWVREKFNLRNSKI